jgi:hypothetical protein
MNEWKWSNNTVAERSKRKTYFDHKELDKTITHDLATIKENNAYLQSFDEKIPLPIQPTQLKNQGLGLGQGQRLGQGQGQGQGQRQMMDELMLNEREKQCSIIAERERLGQTGQNPFLSNHPYIEAIQQSNLYLQPTSS